MDVTKMTVGRIYRLAGGMLLRFYGLYSGKGPCLAFGIPSWPVPDVPVGYSARPEEVLQEITKDDVSWLEDFRVQHLSRGLTKEASEISFVQNEIEKG